MTSNPDSLLAIYLNDHFAGSIAGVELARRVCANHAGTAVGELLKRLAREIEEDRAVLESVMDAVDAGRDPLKPRVAWIAEKLGRLKPNGQLTGRSPLSTVLEFESLELGITGKAALWRALGALDDRRLTAFDLDALAQRAERQLAELEPHRIAAGTQAFGVQASAV